MTKLFKRFLRGPGDSEAIVLLLSLHRKVDQLMADITSIKQLVTDIDTETNAVSAKVDAENAKIADLQAKLDAGGTISSADLQGVQDGLQSVSDRLKVIGADPAQPIPPATS